MLPENPARQLSTKKNNLTEESSYECRPIRTSRRCSREGALPIGGSEASAVLRSLILSSREAAYRRACPEPVEGGLIPSNGASFDTRLLAQSLLRMRKAAGPAGADATQDEDRVSGRQAPIRVSIPPNRSKSGRIQAMRPVRKIQTGQQWNKSGHDEMKTRVPNRDRWHETSACCDEAAGEQSPSRGREA